MAKCDSRPSRASNSKAQRGHTTRPRQHASWWAWKLSGEANPTEQRPQMCRDRGQPTLARWWCNNSRKESNIAKQPITQRKTKEIKQMNVIATRYCRKRIKSEGEKKGNRFGWCDMGEATNNWRVRLSWLSPKAKRFAFAGPASFKKRRDTTRNSGFSRSA